MANRTEAAAAGGQDKETTKLNQIIQVGNVEYEDEVRRKLMDK